MKAAAWTRNFWTKAGAFLCTTLLVPLAALCGGSLLIANEFAWWTGGNGAYKNFLDWSENKYWMRQGINLLYGLHRGAIALLVVSVLLFLFLVIYLARVAGRQPDSDEVKAGWQEKIPFDLYLAVIAGAGAFLAYAAEGVAWWLDDDPFGWALAAVAIITAGTVLLLGTWMTLCTRIKLGKLWRNTVTFQVLSLCWRALCTLGRLVRDLARGLSLMWKTVLSVGAFSALICLFAVERMWLALLILLALFCLAVCAGALQLRKLEQGGAALAAGDMDTKIETAHMYWDFKRHGENLNDISRGMQIAVERQLKSEHLKTELITNVSHDIKTPLTSIINYVGLLQRDPGEEQAKEYLEVLDRQSKRLKKLTEDLVEMSKASTGNLPVNASRRSISELLTQALGEYSERLDKAQLEAVLNLPDREAFAWVDGTLLWRVLDNIFSNACKYALPGTRFYIDASVSESRVKLSFKNISRDRLNVPADELMERFVRGDSARSGEGSGLGLNIAKTLTELQGGTMELFVDGDLFRVDVAFPNME